jgi:hypothetical protein
MDIEARFTFDENTYRHFLNGHATVLHCHHYMSLTTRLALDYADVGGPRILAESAEDAIFPMLESYISEKRISDVDSVLEVGVQYYSLMGLGKMAASTTPAGGMVRLARSHVDEGWVKKWGRAPHAINYFTCGYSTALFSAAFRKRPRSYHAVETLSIAMGDAETVIEVKATQGENS